MADAAAAAPQQSNLFPLLVAKFGIQGALSLLPLLAPGATATQRGFGAAQVAGQGIKGLAGLTGNPTLASISPYIGPVLGAAGLGYNISQIAGDPSLSTGQKAGHSALAASDLGQLLIPGYGQFYGLGLAADALGNQMQKSKSPQIAAGGHQITAPLLPVEGLRRVLAGDQSPRASFNTMVSQMGQVPVVGHATKQFLQAFGLGTPPTTGTQFRGELGQIINQIPSLKGAGLDLSKYNIDMNYYNQLTPEARQAGAQLGVLLAMNAPDAKKDPKAYSIQAQNILLNKFGNQTPDILKKLQAGTTATPQSNTTPQTMIVKNQFQTGVPQTPATTNPYTIGPQPAMGNTLQGILGLLSGKR